MISKINLSFFRNCQDRKLFFTKSPLKVEFLFILHNVGKTKGILKSYKKSMMEEY